MKSGLHGDFRNVDKLKFQKKLVWRPPISFFVFCLCCLIFIPAAFADPIDKEKELERMSRHAMNLQVFEDIMEMRATTKEDKETWSTNTKEKKEKRLFCRGFLSDVRAKRNVEIVKPIYQTDSYTDHKLQEYFGKCPNMELNLTVSPDRETSKQPKVWNSSTYEQKKKGGSVFVWTKGFRLYEIPGKNKARYVLRVAGGYETYRYRDSEIFQKHGKREAQNSPKPITSGSEYRIFTLDTCHDYDWIYVDDEWDYRREKTQNCSNGILTYKGKTYVYEMCDKPGALVRNIRLIDLEVPEKGPNDTLYPYYWACTLIGKEDK